MGYTRRKDFTPEQRIAANTKSRDKYNERKANKLQEEINLKDEELNLKDKEIAALRSAIKESNPGAGSRKTSEGGIKKTGQQARRRRRGGNDRQDNENER